MQIWAIDNIAPAVTSPASDIQGIKDSCESLRSTFYGASAPAEVTPGMLWVRSTDDTLWVLLADGLTWLQVVTVRDQVKFQKSVSGTKVMVADPSQFDPLLGNFFEVSVNGGPVTFGGIPRGGIGCLHVTIFIYTVGVSNSIHSYFDHVRDPAGNLLANPIALSGAAKMDRLECTVRDGTSWECTLIKGS